MPIIFRFIPFVFLILVFPSVNSCTQSGIPSDLPKLTPCIITVTQEGQPLVDANVTLYNSNGDNRWLAGGITDANGIVKVVTNGRFAGAPSGTFNVVIMKFESDIVESPPRPQETDQEYVQWMEKYSQQKPTDVYTLVEKFNTDPEKSPHKLEISGSKPVTVTFDTGKKIREKM
ncbi:MAG: hypothetical protein LBC02_15155 [Planctomycetaceae bacterium]|jgi:hypothetical protein|nr:hypothetical protein [Planctomycetaceae bacterium]